MLGALDVDDDYSLAGFHHTHQHDPQVSWGTSLMWFPYEMQPPEHPPTHRHPPHHSSPILYTCGWRLPDDTLRVCGFRGALGALKAHHKTHFNAGPSNQQVECQWNGCDYKRRSDSTVSSMRRDCIWRHILEVHLGKQRAT
ncbi:hypothetical protein P692DRAFT_20825286 [Suillus brevipes Sb2]|nr:hypothetical protein P692DRAFT_20825286 [Suillus brevipes Sb2]